MHAKRQFSVAALAGKKRARRSAPVEALAVAKAPGAVLGDPKLANARHAAVAEIKSRADHHAANVAPIIRGFAGQV